MASLHQGNQELLVVRDKVERPPGELGVNKSMECDIFPFSGLTLLVGRQEGHPVDRTDVLPVSRPTSKAHMYSLWYLSSLQLVSWCFTALSARWHWRSAAEV